MTLPIIRLAALGLIAATAAASASAGPSAGQWVLDQNRCPDLIEDRIDQRVTTSRRDAIEDRRDMRVVECPRSAWVYVPSRGERVNVRQKYAGVTAVYVGRQGYYQAPTVKRARLSKRQSSFNARAGKNRSSLTQQDCRLVPDGKSACCAWFSSPPPRRSEPTLFGLTRSVKAKLPDFYPAQYCA